MLSPCLSLIIKACLTGQCAIYVARGGAFCCCRCCSTQNCFIKGCMQHSTVFSLSSHCLSFLLEMFSVASKSIMCSYTCNICKWIAVPHIASQGNRKKCCAWRRRIASPISSVIVLHVIWLRYWKQGHTECKLNATVLGLSNIETYEAAGTNNS